MIFNIQTAHWKSYGCPALGSTNLRKQHASSPQLERARLCAVIPVTHTGSSSGWQVCGFD